MAPPTPSSSSTLSGNVSSLTRFFGGGKKIKKKQQTHTPYQRLTDDDEDEYDDDDHSNHSNDKDIPHTTKSSAFTSTVTVTPVHAVSNAVNETNSKWTTPSEQSVASLAVTTASPASPMSSSLDQQQQQQQQQQLSSFSWNESQWKSPLQQQQQQQPQLDTPHRTTTTTTTTVASPCPLLMSDKNNNKDKNEEEPIHEEEPHEKEDTWSRLQPLFATTSYDDDDNDTWEGPWDECSDDSISDDEDSISVDDYQDSFEEEKEHEEEKEEDDFANETEEQLQRHEEEDLEEEEEMEEEEMEEEEQVISFRISVETTNNNERLQQQHLVTHPFGAKDKQDEEEEDEEQCVLKQTKSFHDILAVTPSHSMIVEDEEDDNSEDDNDNASQYHDCRDSEPNDNNFNNNVDTDSDDDSNSEDDWEQELQRAWAAEFSTAEFDNKDNSNTQTLEDPTETSVTTTTVEEEEEAEEIVEVADEQEEQATETIGSTLATSNSNNSNNKENVDPATLHLTKNSIKAARLWAENHKHMARRCLKSLDRVSSSDLNHNIGIATLEQQPQEEQHEESEVDLTFAPVAIGLTNGNNEDNEEVSDNEEAEEVDLTFAPVAMPLTHETTTLQREQAPATPRQACLQPSVMPLVNSETISDRDQPLQDEDEGLAFEVVRPATEFKEPRDPSALKLQPTRDPSATKAVTADTKYGPPVSPSVFALKKALDWSDDNLEAFVEDNDDDDISNASQEQELVQDNDIWQAGGDICPMSLQRVDPRVTKAFSQSATVPSSHSRRLSQLDPILHSSPDQVEVELCLSTTQQDEEDETEEEQEEDGVEEEEEEQIEEPEPEPEQQLPIDNVVSATAALSKPKALSSPFQLLHDVPAMSYDREAFSETYDETFEDSILRGVESSDLMATSYVTVHDTPAQPKNKTASSKTPYFTPYAVEKKTTASPYYTPMAIPPVLVPETSPQEMSSLNASSLSFDASSSKESWLGLVVGQSKKDPPTGVESQELMQDNMAELAAVDPPGEKASVSVETVPVETSVEEKETSKLTEPKVHKSATLTMARTKGSRSVSPIKRIRRQAQPKSNSQSPRRRIMNNSNNKAAGSILSRVSLWRSLTEEETSPLLLVSATDVRPDTLDMSSSSDIASTSSKIITDQAVELVRRPTTQPPKEEETPVQGEDSLEPEASQVEMEPNEEDNAAPSLLEQTAEQGQQVIETLGDAVMETVDQLLGSDEPPVDNTASLSDTKKDDSAKAPSVEEATSDESMEQVISETPKIADDGEPTPKTKNNGLTTALIKVTLPSASNPNTPPDSHHVSMLSKKLNTWSALRRSIKNAANKRRKASRDSTTERGIPAQENNVEKSSSKRGNGFLRSMQRKKVSSRDSASTNSGSAVEPAYSSKEAENSLDDYQTLPVTDLEQRDDPEPVSTPIDLDDFVMDSDNDDDDDDDDDQWDGSHYSGGGEQEEESEIMGGAMDSFETNDQPSKSLESIQSDAAIHAAMKEEPVHIEV